MSLIALHSEPLQKHVTSSSPTNGQDPDVFDIENDVHSFLDSFDGLEEVKCFCSGSECSAMSEIVASFVILMAFPFQFYLSPTRILEQQK